MPPMKTSKEKVKHFHTLRKGLPPVDTKVLQKFCRAPIPYFQKYGEVQRTPGGLLIYQDNGSDVLAIAHLDTVEKARHFSVTKLSHDTKLNCPTVDNRMGAFTILHQLPQMDITPDVLLTTGEEWMQSTALYFNPPSGKTYNWMFQFDRAGKDVVMYEYHDWEMKTILERAGWKVGFGSYSDICELEHLRIKGFNFGVGMHDYHSLDAYVSLNEYLLSLKRFERFYKTQYATHYPHLPKYNIWTPEDGFAFIHKRNSVPYQDTFTEAEIELLEQIDYDGLDLGPGRITPMDMKEHMTNRDSIAKLSYKKDPSLFDDVEVKKETKGLKVVGEVRLSLNTMTDEPQIKFSGSEDEPDSSLAQARKPGGKLRVVHSESGDFEKAITLSDQEELKGKQTLGPVINSNQKEEVNKASKPVSQPKGRIVNLIPLGRVEEDEYEYIQRDDGRWRWKLTSKPKFVREEEFV